MLNCVMILAIVPLASEVAPAQDRGVKPDNVVKPDNAPPALAPEGFRVHLSEAHIAAVNRPRRIYANNDVGIGLGIDLKPWLSFRFDLFDEPGMQVDTIGWCLDEGNIAAYPSKVIPVLQYPGLQKWLAEGIDIAKVLVDETHKRGKEAFWVHRLNGKDANSDFSGGEASPLKKQHPEWLLDSVSWGGEWNFAVPEVRAHKVAVLRELAENYDFDGIDIDFSRYPPNLPVGHQWENREAMTDFMRQVRQAFLEVAARRGRPLLLAARLPESVPGCHYDGIDIETWTRENLLDIIGVGGRSIDLDIAGYRRVIGGRNIKLMPSLDAAHPTDGYPGPDIEFWRGVYGNWWHQGIDGVQTFNFLSVSNRTFDQAQEAFMRYIQQEAPTLSGMPRTPDYQQQALREIGDPKTMRYKDAVYVLQRRYGQFANAWNSYHNANSQAPLPVALPAGNASVLSLYVGDDLNANADRIASVRMRMLLTGVKPQIGASRSADVIEAKLNGILLPAPVQMYGSAKNLNPPMHDSDTQFPHLGRRLDSPDSWHVFTLKPQYFAVGENLISIRLANWSSGALCSVIVEKLEVSVDYKE